MICDIGVNNMSRGWTRADKWNYRVYVVWRSMIRLCYSEKYHETHPTYKNCTVCERWLKLSNFVEDIVKIDGYNYWLSGFDEKINPYQLDKDIKSGGINKCYSLENCMFVSASENTRQMLKTRDNTKISETWKNKSDEELAEIRRKKSEANKGENNPHARKIVSVDPFTKRVVFTWQYVKQATEFFGINRNTLNRYLRGKAKSEHLYNGFLFYYLDEWEQVNK